MVQITFLTLYLGLTLGVQPIEVTVTGGPAASVEIVLDGAPIGRLQGPPWRGQIDFGPALLPHHLAARALDAEDRELGTTAQWLNLPRPPAEVDILLENGPAGRPVAARLTWQSLTGEQPSAIGVTFDDRPLVLEPDGRIPLPAWDPATSHVLTAELRFSGALTARRDVVFGGPYGDEVATELTAVPIRPRPERKLPAPEQMAGWLRAGGLPVAVAAVEEGPAELVVVHDLAVRARMEKLLGGGSRTRPTLNMRGATFDARSGEKRRYEMTLGADGRVVMVWPVPQTIDQPGSDVELFSISRPFEPRDGGILWYLARFFPTADGPNRQRLADAVAVAGLQALRANHRRAVLLVLSENPLDQSSADAARVRRYLESIRVPLYVWTLGDPAAPAAAAWGAEPVSTLGKMNKAFRRLKKDLADQRLLWVDGRYLPQALELTPEAAAVVEPIGSP